MLARTSASRWFSPLARTLAIAGLVVLTGCTLPADPPPMPPTGVYDHDTASENSRAEPAPTGGTSGALTRPLTTAGWFCAQARSNADGRALWCRIGRRDATDMVSAQTAHFLLDSRDRLAWAWFPPADQGGADHITAAATSALGTIWTDAPERIRQEIDDHGRETDEMPSATAWRDEHADYHFSDLDGLIVTAGDAAVRRWPSGGEHYATTMSSAVKDLLAGGYDCHYPPQTNCNRVQSNGYFQVTLREDQIITARFGIGSLIEAGRQRHPLSQEFPHGLTFLTDAVRGPVTERIEQARREGTSFAGIVAGTVVIIDADRGAVDGDDLVAYLSIQIGAPLAATLPL
ncbi:hypothetical protein FXF51_45335 [Nonomuraea sp. PA05]|nr:hypothetical protein FXF51_45335 [Nonomuraea sp. PA05]